MGNRYTVHEISAYRMGTNTALHEKTKEMYGYKSWRTFPKKFNKTHLKHDSSERSRRRGGGCADGRGQKLSMCEKRTS